MAVMEINALITKVIFDKETNRNFYVEESIPLDWMYPYLEPHGLILKLNHKPLERLSNEMIERDRNYWSKSMRPMIGDWLNEDTTLNDVAAFVKRVFLCHDFKDFQGNLIFERNTYVHRMFAKERAAIAGLYAWRAEHSSDATEKNCMGREADFAFREAWALCPDSPEIVLRYVNFLMEATRTDDAILVAKNCLPMDTRDDEVSNLLSNLEQYKKECDEWTDFTNKGAAMENEARINPTDYTNLFSLAWYYIQAQQTNRAAALVERMISQLSLPPDALHGAADFFVRINQLSNLEVVLKMLTVTVPSEPEAPYDLARLETLLKKDDDAIKYLRTAIRLSDQRLKTNPKALDIRKAARNETNFDPIRNRSDFRKLVLP
jgi:tetratricopeptide (TPR) repeat protein